MPDRREDCRAPPLPAGRHVAAGGGRAAAGVGGDGTGTGGREGVGEKGNKKRLSGESSCFPRCL